MSNVPTWVQECVHENKQVIQQGLIVATVAAYFSWRFKLKSCLCLNVNFIDC